MKTITFSLIFAFIISSVSVGWLIDVAYQNYFAPPSTDVQKKVSLLKLSGQAIANNIDQYANPEGELQKWHADQALSLELINMGDIALPSSLRVQLESGEALVLDSAQGPSIYYYLPSADKALKLSAKSLFELEEPTNQLLLTIAFYIGISAVLTLWVYPLARRLFMIRQAAASFGEGNLNTRLEVGSLGGIRDVELAFNSMTQQIQTLLNDVKLLSGGISHDLKTSLARLRLGIDIIQDDPESISDTYLRRLSDDTDEMIRMVHMMLEYTQLDLQLSDVDKDEIELDALVQESVDKLLLGMPKPNQILCHIDEQCYGCLVKGHKLYILMVLNNLMSNAANYANSKIEINLGMKNAGLCLEISDDGHGIPKEFRKDIFKPFFRVPQQTNQSNEKHYGLGLAISKRIVELHGGKLQLVSQEQGTTMQVYFPLA